jgi:hypothetical protein
MFKPAVSLGINHHKPTGKSSFDDQDKDGLFTQSRVLARPVDRTPISALSALATASPEKCSHGKFIKRDETISEETVEAFCDFHQDTVLAYGELLSSQGK